MIPLMKNTFFQEPETKSALADFIRNADKLSMGEQCRRFEEAFALHHASPHAVLVNSGGSANLLLLQALKNLGRLKAGDRVGFTALTWSTNVMPIIQMGFEPVPVDIELATLNTSAKDLARRLDDTDIACFFITNVLGFAGDLDRIRTLCRERDIILIEDNCESLGTELAGGKTGTFGLAATFSFYVAHHLSTVEGGMLITRDDELASMLRMARANGWDRNLPAKEQVRLRQSHAVESELFAKYVFYDLAFNVRPTEITGFLGLSQLERLAENVAARQRLYVEFEAILQSHGDFIALDRGHLKSISPFAMPFLCRSQELFAKYTSAFSGAGIEIRPVIAGNMQNQPFYRKYVDAAYELPNTDFVHRCGFYSGLYPEMTQSDVETIKSCLMG